MIRVIYIEPGQEPEVREIESDYKAMQALVGGMLEVLFLDGHSVSLYFNEEGRLTGLPLNRWVPVPHVGTFDILGPMFVSAIDDEGSDVGLTDEQIETWMAAARSWRRA
jgi:hypothetical protein